ncbi:MAG: YihY/virulence factor BrkB family protein [Hyphomicrobiaceae bacterium]
MVTEFSNDRLTMVGAGAAFYVLLALVPALSAFVAVYGLIFDRSSVVEQVSRLSGFLAPEVRTLIEGQLTRLVSASSGSLSLAFAVSLALSIWSSSAGTKAMMDGLNIVYDEKEKRGFVRFYGTALALTLGGLVGFVAVIGATIAVPIILGYVVPGTAGGFIRFVSFALLLGFLWIGLLVLYKWGPSRDAAEWRWLAPGTIIAVVALAAFSLLFSWFARTFAGYASYGSLGAIIAFMTWVWISAVIVLLGAEINAEMEHQTAHDTTTGSDMPMGSRGAAMADTLPDQKDSGAGP